MEVIHRERRERERESFRGRKMEAESVVIPWLRASLSIVLFSFTSCFLILSLTIYLMGSRTWCDCHVCRAYLGSTWAAEFDNLCDWYTHLLRSSPTGTIHIHVLGNTVTANPKNVEHVLSTRFHNFPKGKPFAAILGDLLGRGIFNADGETWQFQRKLASAELSSVSVRSHTVSVVSAEIRRRLLPLLDVFSAGRSGGVVDLQDVFRRFTFDTTSKISFGVDPACLGLSMPVSEFSAAFDTASRLSALRATSAAPAVWRLKRMLNLGSERELRRSIRLINALAELVIKERRKLDFSTKHDLLSQFMGSVDDANYLRDIVVSFLLAGRDTVAAGLAGFFLLLSSHPPVLAKMLDEISRVMEIGSEIASYEELSKMQYVHAAVHEGLRLYPPVQFDSKFCSEDDVLPDGTAVGKGTRVTYHPYAMARMESVWGPDCREFRPERWLRDGAFVPQSPFKYPVFQGGPRVCLGKELALMEMKAVAVAVVRGFDVEVVGGERSPKFAPGLTANFREGLPARVRRR